MELVVIGAGSVGLNLGARLARAGCQVHLVVRHPDTARLIEREGVRVVDPESGETWCSGAKAVLGLSAAGELLRTAPALLCTRAPDTDSVAASLAGAAPGATIVSAQNDVDNEEKLARHFSRVAGLCLRQTCTRVAPNVVHAPAAGRIVVGVHPGAGSQPEAASETAEVVEAAAASFRAVGYDVGISKRIADDKWLKLCANLMSAPNALVVRRDHTSWAFVEIKARLLEEAHRVLRAAGIAARSCDGRDRSLEEEIRYQREALALGTSARSAKLFNAVWTALRSGAALEADLYHRRILDLARAHGVATPANERVLAALLRARREALGPECLRAEELLPPG